MPRSITSSPARRLWYSELLIRPNIYGGSRSTREAKWTSNGSGTGSVVGISIAGASMLGVSILNESLMMELTGGVGGYRRRDRFIVDQTPSQARG